MRHCYGETITVFEEENEDLAELLLSVALQVKANDGGYQHVSIGTDFTDGSRLLYRATLYAH